MKHRRGSRTSAVTLERGFRRIMLAVDGPENSGRAIEIAMNLASANGAQLVVSHVAAAAAPMMAPFGFGVPMSIPTYVFDAQVEEQKRTSKWLDRLVGVAEERGIDVTKAMIRSEGPIAEVISRKASEEDADLIVIGRNDRGFFERLVLGSTSTEVVKQAKCPVLVVR